jgi:hypothetical protein
LELSAAKAISRRTIQQFVIQSSNFNRFIVERTKQANITKITLEGRAIENKIVTNKAVAATFVYSISKINEKYIELYSVIKPATKGSTHSTLEIPYLTSKASKESAHYQNLQSE